jgi:transposase-like protein
LSSGDFAPALSEFFGSAAELSASVVTRLTTQWQGEQRAFAERRLEDRDFVYLWADGVHFNVRLEEARLCCLVIVGVRSDGTNELVAITDGHRESTDSWADLLRDLKRRGMKAPMVAVGDGPLGFWAALRTVAQFYDFPAEHWIHLKTTNPIESTFATVRLRTKVTKGPGSRAAGLAMAFKLIEAAEQRWRSVNAPHLVALVRAGATFDKGVMIERPNQQDQEAAA